MPSLPSLPGHLKGQREGGFQAPGRMLGGASGFVLSLEFLCWPFLRRRGKRKAHQFQGRTPSLGLALRGTGTVELSLRPVGEGQIPARELPTADAG
jgi:hypothetical protein